jgi:hypothetical protein
MSFVEHAAHVAAEYGDELPETASEEQAKKQQDADAQYTQQYCEWGLAALQPPDKAHCCGCQQPVMCTTCDPCGALLCPDCDSQWHSRAHFHTRQHFLQGYAEPLGPCQFIVDTDEQQAPQPPVVQSGWLAMHWTAGCAWLHHILVKACPLIIAYIAVLLTSAQLPTGCVHTTCHDPMSNMVMSLPHAARRLTFHASPLQPCACGAKDCWQLLPSSEEEPDLIVYCLTGAPAMPGM